MKKILTLAIVTVLFFSTSCTKGDLDVSVSGEIQIGPVLLSWGNTGTYGNYYGGLPGYGVDYFIGFIGAKPTDGNNISILTSTGAPLCVASCTAT